jgi:hypothetical protein
MPLLCGPFDSISQSSLRPLATTPLASDVQNSNSLRSSITPGITRRPERLSEHESRRVGSRVHAVVGRGILGNCRLEFIVSETNLQGETKRDQLREELVFHQVAGKLSSTFCCQRGCRLHADIVVQLEGRSIPICL